MKNPTLLTLLLHALPFLAVGQSGLNFFSLEFLEINAQAQSKALGETGVVAPQFNFHSATQQNPALLIRHHRQLDVNVKYMPWLKVQGLGHYFLEVGGMCNFNDRHAFGLNLKYLSDGLLRIPSTGAKSDYAVSMSYAYKFAKKWSAGTTYKLIRNDILSSDGSIGMNSWAVDLGVHYQNTKQLSPAKQLHFNWGMALTNLGPKLDYTKLDPTPNLNTYLPLTLKTGALLGLQKNKNDQYTFSYNIIYQVDKRLVPLPNTIDEDNNGQYDYLEWKIGQSIIESFQDAPDGFRGELAELIHKFGFEYRIDDHKYRHALAFRLGYHHASEYRFDRKNIAAGLSLHIGRFYADLTYVSSLNRDQAVYENTLLFSIGSRQLLSKKTNDNSKRKLFISLLEVILF